MSGRAGESDQVREALGYGKCPCCGGSTLASELYRCDWCHSGACTSEPCIVWGTPEPCCDEGMTCLVCDPDATFADVYGGGNPTACLDCGSWDDTHPGDCAAVRATPSGLADSK